MAKKDNTIWWVIGVIVVLVILVGGGIGIFGGNKSDGTFLLRDLDSNEQVYQESVKLDLMGSDILAETTNCRVYIEESIAINSGLFNIRILDLKNGEEKTLTGTTLKNPNDVRGNNCLFQTGNAISF